MAIDNQCDSLATSNIQVARGNCGVGNCRYVRRDLPRRSTGPDAFCQAAVLHGRYNAGW